MTRQVKYIRISRDVKKHNFLFCMAGCDQGESQFKQRLTSTAYGSVYSRQSMVENTHSTVER